MASCGIENNTKYFIQPSELCAFKALYTLKTNYGSSYYTSNTTNIFNDNFKINSYKFNYNYRLGQDTSNEYIYKYNDNNTDLCYNVGKNEYMVNCAIQNNNPLYTYDEENKNCTLIPNINLTEGFEYFNDNTSNYLLYKFPKNNDNTSIYKNKNKKGFCENRWYDWIITPNYHFGNSYEKDVGNFTKDDIRKCYKPCIKGYLPYKTANNEFICIPKNEIENGLYKNKMDFSTIALLNLIGNTKEDLENLYFLNRFSVNNSYNNNSNYEIDTYIYKQIDFNTEIEEILKEIKNTINTYIIDEKSMNTRNIDKNISTITYKNPLFNENDIELITLKGMDENGMMSDEILVHSYMIASYYSDFYNDFIITKKNYYDDNMNFTFNKIKKDKDTDKGNIKTNLNKLFDYDKNKFQRLTNILMKSINICYDNNTDFSRNLIDYTKLALNRLKNDDIKEDYLQKLNKITISKLEIPYISVEQSEGNIHLSNYIINNFKDGFNDEKDKEKIRNYYNNNNDVLFYTLEDKERINKCSIGQISNGKDCVECDKYCNIETCKTDVKCEYYCEEKCKISKEKEKNIKCGVKKQLKNNEEIKNEKIMTPVEDDNKLPDFNNMIKVIIKIFISLLFLYMCYVFYQIYGETLITIYNWLEVNINSLFYLIKAYINGESVKENYDFMMKEYIRNNTVAKFEKVSTAIKG